jgi:sec-independent protein translocase protein TatC
VTPVLRTYRKYAIVLVLVVAAIVAPDVVSQTIVAIPMLLIYEASIFISVLVTKIKKNNYECYY